MARRNSLQARIEDRIAQRSDGVFLAREFADLGGTPCNTTLPSAPATTPLSQRWSTLNLSHSAR